MSTALSDPLVGQLLDGRYRVTRRLARGGMATVYTALDTRLGREVALKVMHPNLAVDREFVSRFIREAHAAARLSHPAAVAVYDQSADSGHVFIAMEYVRGRTLRDWLRERGRLTPRETFAVLEPVLAALAAAHAAGLVHRDVKPENVLIADDGRVKVADFGLARAVSNATVTGTLIGTVAYLSPEQVDRGTADQRSDVYAAGILLYECLTGHQPHYGETPLQIAYQHVNSDVPAPSLTRPTLPGEIDALVRRATCRNAAGRPADAGEFLRELLALRRGLSADALDDVAGAQAAAEATTMAVSGEEVGQHRTPAQPTLSFETSSGGGILPPTTVVAAPPRFARRRSRGRLALAAVVCAALALGVGGWRLAADNSVTTPSLLNLSKDQALTKARTNGLQLRFADAGQFSENVGAGEVLSTDPLPGHPVAKHGWITVVLSKGPERIAVPASVAGAGLDDAKQQLIDAGLSPGTVTHKYSDTVAAGQVASTDPAVGTALKRNAVVNLVVSDGGKPTAVPNVIGDSVDDATRTLQQAGFQVATQQVASGADSGTVVAQSPTPDQKAPHNSTITLQVSGAPGGNGAMVTVPNLVGMSREQAEQVLERMSLESDSSNFGFGNKVTGQDPKPGTQVPTGTTIHLQYAFF
jgi:serine/threonine-protein kinase